MHYRLLLLEKHIEKHDGPDERRALTVSLCVSTLERLEHIDPPRKRRYQELGMLCLPHRCKAFSRSISQLRRYYSQSEWLGRYLA